MNNCYKCLKPDCGCGENPDVPANCNPTLPKEARLEIGREPPHPSIRAHLREEFRLETCDTCFKKPNRPVCGFIAANQNEGPALGRPSTQVLGKQFESNRRRGLRRKGLAAARALPITLYCARPAAAFAA